MQQKFNNLRNTNFVKPPPFLANNAPTFNFGARAQPSSFNNLSSSASGPSLFGSQSQTLTREKAKEKNDTQLAIDDTVYELPEDTVSNWAMVL